MHSTASKLFPIDDYSYDTAFGRYVATIVSGPAEIADVRKPQTIEVEFRNEDFARCPVRRLTLFTSPADLSRNRESLFSIVMQWVFSAPSAANYCDLFLSLDGSSLIHRVPLIREAVPA